MTRRPKSPKQRNYDFSNPEGVSTFVMDLFGSMERISGNIAAARGPRIIRPSRLDQALDDELGGGARAAPNPPAPKSSSGVSVAQARALLGVTETATPEQIRSRYKFLALQCHPDKVPEAQRTEATEYLKSLNAAYKLLGKKR